MRKNDWHDCTDECVYLDLLGRGVTFLWPVNLHGVEIKVQEQPYQEETLGPKASRCGPLSFVT